MKVVYKQLLDYKFLQDLLEKRTDSDLIDDNGAIDRYHKFVKYKSALNDDVRHIARQMSTIWPLMREEQSRQQVTRS